MAIEENLQQTFILAFTQQVDVNLIRVFLNDKMTKKVVKLGDNETLEEAIKKNTDPNENLNEIEEPIANEENPGGGIVEEPVESCDSEATWKQGSSWVNGEEYECSLDVNVNNLDENISSWTLSVDVPLSLDTTGVNAWGSSSTTFEEHDTFYRINLTSYSWNGTVSNGGTLTQSMNLKFTDTNVDFKVYNVLFNGKKVKKLTEAI